MSVIAVVAITSIGIIIVYSICEFVRLAWQLTHDLAAQLGFVKPTRDDLIVRGWAAERHGQWADALTAYEEVLRNQPGDEETEARRAGLLQRHPELAREAERAQRERLAALEPFEVLVHLAWNHSKRKQQLFVAACCRVCHPTADEHTQAAIELLELRADRLLANPTALSRAIARARASGEGTGPEENARGLIVASALELADMRFGITAAFLIDAALPLVLQVVARDEMMRLAECVFGLRGHTPEAAPSWLTETVIAIAQQMYESRDFSAMPILADALQDAGCDNADILDHCRGPLPSRPLSEAELTERDEKSPHVCGCWVVDLVLGKQ